MSKVKLSDVDFIKREVQFMRRNDFDPSARKADALKLRRICKKALNNDEESVRQQDIAKCILERMAGNAPPRGRRVGSTVTKTSKKSKRLSTEKSEKTSKKSGKSTKTSKKSKRLSTEKSSKKSSRRKIKRTKKSKK